MDCAYHHAHAAIEDFLTTFSKTYLKYILIRRFLTYHCIMAATSENKRSNALQLTAPPSKNLVAQFTKRDTILYALGIGCCSCTDGYDDKVNDDRELRYVYENHPQFEAFPTFLLALSFVAEQSSGEGVLQSNKSKLGFGIRPFPPESMSNYLEDGTNCGILPKEFFKDQNDIEEAQGLPILHIHQSLTLHDEIKPQKQIEDNIIDPPTQLQLQAKILSVKPRSIGTFVTSETKYYQDGKCIATAQMVALILGLDPDIVVPWKAPASNHHGSESRKANNKQSKESGNDTDEVKEETVVEYRIPKNAALLYRLSGDYNSIHVEDDDILGGSDDHSNGSKQRGPVLMGLCTLGYAMRAVLHHAENHRMKQSNDQGHIRLESVQCNFVKPVYVGDTLRVVVWTEEDCTSGEERTLDVYFRVCRVLENAHSNEKQSNNNKQYDLVVDKGKAKFRKEATKVNMPGTVSRL